MPGINLICGPYLGYDFFKNEILSAVRRQDDDYLVLLPVNRSVRRLKQELLEAAPGQVMADPPIFTFSEFLLKLYGEMDGARRILPARLIRLILEKDYALSATDLQFFPPFDRRKRGLIEQISRLITEFRRFGYASEQLRKTDPACFGGQSARQHDLLLFMQALEEALGEIYIDEPSAEFSAARFLNRDLLKRIAGPVGKVYISGYGLFTPAMFTFIEHVSAWAEVSVRLEYLPENPQAFALTRPAFEQLQQMGARQIFSEPEAISLSLFNRKTLSQNNLTFPVQLQISQAESRRAEVLQIARQIQSGSTATGRIGVTFPDIELYAPLIRQIFSQAGLPFNLSTGFSVLRIPVVQQMLRALRLISRGFPVEEVLSLLNSRLVLREQRLDSAFLTRILRRSGQRFLSGDWAQRQKQIILILRQKAMDDLPKAEEQLNLLAEFLLPLREVALHGRPAEMYQQITALWRRLGLTGWFEQGGSGLGNRDREHEFRAFNRFIKEFDLLSGFIQRIWPEISLLDYLDHIELTLKDSSYNLSDRPVNAVQILPRLEILATDMDELFIGGLNDGDFPRRNRKDILLSDAMRQGLGLVASEDLLEQDRFIFYQLISAPAKRLHLSYPLYEEERALVPSTFLSELQELTGCPVEPPTVHGHDLLAHSDPLGRLGNLLRADSDEETALTNIKYPQNIPALLDKIRVVRQRRLFQPFAGYEGVLNPETGNWPELRAKYAGQIWSVSRLEKYAFCPMSFYLSELLGLEEMPEMEEGWSAIERGLLLHDLLRGYYAGLSAGERQNPLKYFDRLQAAAGQRLKDMPYTGIFWEIEKALILGSPERKGILQAALETDEKAIAETGFLPSYFEWSFGATPRPQNDAQSVPAVLKIETGTQTIRFRGQVDRMDADRHKRLFIWDYKTGDWQNQPKLKKIWRGTDFQLPLYLLAAEQLLPGQTVVSAGYFILKGTTRRGTVFADGEASDAELFSDKSCRLPGAKINGAPENLTLNQLLETVSRHVSGHVSSLMQGRFPHSSYPEEATCQSFCQFRRMCLKHKAKQIHFGQSGEDE